MPFTGERLTSHLPGKALNRSEEENVSMPRFRHPLVLIAAVVIGAHIAFFVVHKKLEKVGKFQRPHAILTGHRVDTAPNYPTGFNADSGVCKAASPVPAATYTIDPKQSGKLVSDYYANATKIYNDGHGIHLDVGGNGTLKLDGLTYQLVRIDLQDLNAHGTGDMVAHLVHKTDAGQVAVLSVLLHRGKANPTLSALLRYLPLKAGEHNSLWDVRIDPNALLPKKLDYYSYSVDAPNVSCGNTVRWLALKHPVELSSQQLAAYERVLEGKVSKLPVAGNDVEATPSTS